MTDPMVKSMTTAQLRAELKERQVKTPTRASKAELAALVEEAREQDGDVPPASEPEDVIDGELTDEELDELQVGSAVAVQERPAPQRQTFSERERELIARIVAPGHTADELALFERICIRTGLDPFARQIYSIKRNKKMPDGGWQQVATPQTSIDGFRLIAHRSGQYQGQTPPEWYDDEKGEWVTVWLKETPPPAARVGVYRTGFATPLIRTVTWREMGGTTATWKSMPALMLAKTAESQALRAAFPQELSGLYAEEEMAQSDNGVEHSYSSALEPVRQEEAGQNAAPQNVGEILERLAAQLGEDEAVEWLREAVLMYSQHKGQQVSEWRDLPPAVKTELGRRLAGVVVDLEEIQAETSVDWRMSTGVRSALVPVFGRRLDGIALRGPVWRLGPDEADRPTREEYMAAQAESEEDDEGIEFMPEEAS